MTTTLHKSKWFVPLLSLGLGLACLAAFWIGGDLRSGLSSLAVMVAFGAIVLLGGRSETIRGLRGDGRDERFALIDLTATAAAGFVLILLVLGLIFWEWAHGRDGSPYTQLGAITGLVYLVAVVVLRVRG
jgi:hypothetical protein